MVPKFKSGNNGLIDFAERREALDLLVDLYLSQFAFGNILRSCDKARRPASRIKLDFAPAFEVTQFTVLAKETKIQLLHLQPALISSSQLATAGRSAA